MVEQSFLLQLLIRVNSRPTPGISGERQHNADERGAVARVRCMPLLGIAPSLSNVSAIDDSSSRVGYDIKQLPADIELKPTVPLYPFAGSRNDHIFSFAFQILDYIFQPSPIKTLKLFAVA